jgi:hypothetical protein
MPSRLIFIFSFLVFGFGVYCDKVGNVETAAVATRLAIFNMCLAIYLKDDKNEIPDTYNSVLGMQLPKR